MAQDLAAFHSASPEIGHQQHGHHLVSAESRPVTLLATSNGTQIAVQVILIRNIHWEYFINNIWIESRVEFHKLENLQA